MMNSSQEYPPNSDRLKFVAPIHRNILRAAQQLIVGMKELEIPFQSVLPAGTVETITSLSLAAVDRITPELKEMIRAVWRDSGVQHYFQQHQQELRLGGFVK